MLLLREKEKMSEFLDVVPLFSEELFLVGNLNNLIINIVLAVIYIIVGICLGKLVKFLLKKIIYRAGVERTSKKSFFKLFLNVVKWSIYIAFVVLALRQLSIPQLTDWLVSGLVVIPALVGALILIAVGFGIAMYLKDIVDESRVIGYEKLSFILFYFIVYVFMVFALKTALISIDKGTVNLIVVILTGIVFAGLTFWHIKKK